MALREIMQDAYSFGKPENPIAAEKRSDLAIPPIGAAESLSRAPLKGGACAIVDATAGSAPTVTSQGFKLRAPKGWPILQRRTSCLWAASVSAVSSGPTRARAPPWPGQGLRAAGPATGSALGSAKRPADYG